MPELPDVAVFRDYLDATALHERIEEVEVRDDYVLEDLSARTLAQRLEGRSLESTEQHGKYLLVRIGEDGGWLVLHFGMTGFLKYFREDEQAPGHIRVLLRFENGYRLAFDCRRKLGKVALADSPEAWVRAKELGPDALALDAEGFLEVLAGRRGRVKSALMNQSILAGVGNVYADEALFQARIHPERSVDALDESRRRELFEALHDVLESAIEARADPERVPDRFLLPHRRRGKSCPRCGGQIERIELSGRATYFCPREQSS